MSASSSSDSAGWRHARAHLDAVGITEERRQVVGGVVDGVGQQRRTAGHMGQVRRRSVADDDAAHGVTRPAPFVEEQPLSAIRRLGRRRCCRRPLCGDPAVEVLARLGDHQQAHVGVLQTAELGALAAIDAGLVGLDHEDVRTVRQGVELAVQVGDPEAVDDVGRQQPQLDLFTDGNVDLVGHGDPLVPILRRPPELVPDDVDHDAPRWCGSRDGLHRRHAEHQRHDQHRERHENAETDDPRRGHPPGDLWAIGHLAAVAGGLASAGEPSAQHGHDEQDQDEDVHGAAHDQEHPPQLRDLLGGRSALPRKHRAHRSPPSQNPVAARPRRPTAHPRPGGPFPARRPRKPVPGAPTSPATASPTTCP